MFRVTEKQLEKLEEMQNAGGFRRFAIDIVDDKTKKPTKKDKKAKENFFENIRFYN